MPLLLDGRLHAIDVLEPAGGADHHVHAQRRDALDVFDHRGGNRKIDGHIDAAKVLRRDAFEVGVVEFVELQRDREAVLRARAAR